MSEKRIRIENWRSNGSYILRVESGPFVSNPTQPATDKSQPLQGQRKLFLNRSLSPLDLTSQGLLQFYHRDRHRYCFRFYLPALLATVSIPISKWKPRFSQLTASVLVGAVRAIFLSVTEETSVDASTVAASQLSFGAKRFVGVQERFDLTLFVLQFAILHGFLPIARLLFDVEKQTGRTTDSLKTLKNDKIEKEVKQKKQQNRRQPLTAVNFRMSI